ncbi:MAG: DUF3175 domain-containing protein [Burkholderiales bacterium]|nr:DUF3175 domain-containing protein [Burkholderiales bacterium]
MNAAASARSRRPKSAPRRWSQQVTLGSDALDLESGLFTWKDPRAIARSLKASAEASRRRKAAPFASAMSMLSFYINRAGAKLSAAQRARLEAAKDELRVLFGRPRKRARKPG